MLASVSSLLEPHLEVGILHQVIHSVPLSLSVPFWLCGPWLEERPSGTRSSFFFYLKPVDIRLESGDL
ncbi:hypothetical protein CC2G_006016 [Coprinopsis cinerea AmutBmut pab1-1]|nr:hypothetical protein CC2G_006016 [Coprinopsis cinerea AmutBmut pab1-1]